MRGGGGVLAAEGRAAAVLASCEVMGQKQPPVLSAACNLAWERSSVLGCCAAADIDPAAAACGLVLVIRQHVCAVASALLVMSPAGAGQVVVSLMPAACSSQPRWF